MARNDDGVWMSWSLVSLSSFQSNSELLSSIGWSCGYPMIREGDSETCEEELYSPSLAATNRCLPFSFNPLGELTRFLEVLVLCVVTF